MKVSVNAYMIADESGNLLLRGGENSRENAFIDEPQTKIAALFKSRGHAQQCLKKGKYFSFSKSANVFCRSNKGMGRNYKQWLRVVPCTITIDF